MRLRVTIRYTETQRKSDLLLPAGQLQPQLTKPIKAGGNLFLETCFEKRPWVRLLRHGLCSGSLSILVVPRHAAAPIEILPINPGRSWEAGTVGDWTMTTKIALGFACAGSCTEAPPALPSFTSCPSRLLFRKIFESFPVFSCFHRILSSLKAESLLTYGMSASC